MRRRDFISLFGSAAALAWPLAARAQQHALPLVGFVHARSPDETSALVEAFRGGLAETGFTEGQTVAIEFRFAGGQYDQLPQIFSDLIKRNVAILVAGADPAAVAAKRVAENIPMVFAVGNDPVALGLVTSFSRPGGNATGLTILAPSLEPKRLGLLREILPSNATIGVLLNPMLPLSQKQAQAVQDAARSINLAIQL
jgi:putative ABC transport system substrate-binding protein